MNWITKTVFFPVGKLAEESISVFLARYMVDTSLEDQYLDDTLVTLSPREPNPSMATVYGDDVPLSRFRKASLFDGTIPTSAVYDPPLENEWANPAGHTFMGSTIRVGWPEQFLSDLQRDPQPEPELFEGVTILS